MERNEQSQRTTARVSRFVVVLEMEKLTVRLRAEFVRLYTSFLLESSVSSQFSAFSAGFTEVTSGNSLSLFKGEELELLVRGSDEQLDVEQLKGVTVYQGWTENDETVQ